MIRRLGFIAISAAVWWIGVAIWIGIGPRHDTEPKADAALVLGAAVDGGTPSPVFQQRIAHAISLYKSGRVGRIIFTGGKSPEDSLSEAEAARLWAMARGVPANVILTEQLSQTTLQNFSEALPVVRDARIKGVIVVSDPLHMRRAMVMARSLGIEASASATPKSQYRSAKTRVPFLLRETYFIHHFWFFGA